MTTGQLRKKNTKKSFLQNKCTEDKTKILHTIHAINLETTLAKETTNGNFDSRREEKRRSR